MFKSILTTIATVLTVATCSLTATSASAQSDLYYQVQPGSQRLEMTVNSSRILTFDFDVPKLLVNDTKVVRASPLSRNKVQVWGLQPGVTQVNVWDANEQVRSIDVLVTGDVRELQDILDTEFPSSNIRVRPSNGSARGSVIVSGFVSRADEVTRIVKVCEDFFPNVINNLDVGGMQQVVLHVKVIEISRTKLRQSGIDWGVLTGNDFIIGSAAQLISAATTQGGTLTPAGAGTLAVGILNNSASIGFYIDVLRQNNVAKLLAEPTVVAVSGRAASFNSGGEIPVPVSSGLGATSVEYREFGTQIDFLPIVLGNGLIRLECRPTITEVDDSLRDQATGTPGFRTRRVDTGVEMRAGQTLALAGLIQNRVSSIDRGIPWAADMPWVGPLFGRVEERVNEVELLILVTPEFVEPMEAHEVPACGPGEQTTSPSDVDFYFRRYREVPRCDKGLPSCGPLSCNTPHATNYGGASIGQSNPHIVGRQASGQRMAQSRPTQQQLMQQQAMLRQQNSRQAPNVVQNRFTNVSNRSTPAPQLQQPIQRPAPQRPQVQPLASLPTANGEPAMIGPVGYDVIK